MTITSIAEQRTTAGTDVLLCAIAVAAAFHVRGIARHQPWKSGLWALLFGLAALTAGLGAVLHGFDLPRPVHQGFWIALLAPAALTVALLGVAVIYETWGLRIARRALPVLGAATLLLFAVRVGTGGSDGSFRLFVAAIALLSLGGYALLALRRRVGATWMTLGILVSLLGIAVHLRPQTSFTLFWTFDHNGIYHLVQIAGIAILTTGLRKSLRSHADP